MRSPDTLSTPVSRPELSDPERNALSIDNLDAWRELQKQELADLRAGADSFMDTTYVETFQNNIDGTLDAYLDDKGIASDSDNYNEVREMYREASIDRVHDSEWLTSPASRGEDPAETKSVREMFADKIDARLGETSSADSADVDDEEEQQPDTPDTSDTSRTPDTPDAPATPESDREKKLEEARKAVEEARESWAARSAKRQGRLKIFDRDRKREIPEQEDYFQKVNALGRLELADMLADDTIEEKDRNVAVIEYLFKEQARLRELTTEKLKSTKVSKVIEWMNRGSVATRIAKGMAIGAGFGLVGTFAAGALGAGAAAAGVAAGTRFFRGFALKEKDARGMRTVDEALDKEDIMRLADAEMARTDEHRQMHDRTYGSDYFAKAGFHIDNAFEDDTQYEQVKRRKAVAWGLGAVAAGSALAYGAHAAAEAVSNHSLQMFKPFDSDVSADSDSHSDHNSSPDPKHEEGGNGSNETDGNDKGADSDTNANVGETGIDWSHYSEAQNIYSGKGFYEVFQEMNIPQDKWADVLNEAGPELQGQGWAYRMPNGEWGILQTGTMPNDALDAIAKAAANNGVSIK